MNYPQRHTRLWDSGKSGYEYQEAPAIRLYGVWLEKLEFKIEWKVDIRCEQGKLIIR